MLLLLHCLQDVKEQQLQYRLGMVFMADMDIHIMAEGIMVAATIDRHIDLIDRIDLVQSILYIDLTDQQLNLQPDHQDHLWDDPQVCQDQ